MATPRTVLGISPGTQQMGIAVFQDGQLIEWKVLKLRGRWSKGKQQQILQSIHVLTEYFAVTVIAIKKPDPLRSSHALNILAKSILLLAKRKRLRVRHYTLYDMHRFCGKKYEDIHKGLAEYISDTYPMLKTQCLKERNASRPYYAKMFEAVILCCMQTCENIRR